MVARATPADVKCIKPTTLDDAVVQCFIDAATLVVDRVAECGSFTDPELKQIEIFYSAHLLSASDPDLVEEKVEGFTNKFARGSNSGTGVKSSQYGQMANTMSRGCLAELDKPVAFYVAPC